MELNAIRNEQCELLDVRRRDGEGLHRLKIDLEGYGKGRVRMMIIIII